MKTFTVKFTGRLVGAIGKTYKINAKVKAPKDATKEEIMLKLHDKYEHITNVIIL